MKNETTITGGMTAFENIEEAIECYCDLESVWRSEAATEYWHVSGCSKDEFIEHYIEQSRRLLSLSE